MLVDHVVPSRVEKPLCVGQGGENQDGGVCQANGWGGSLSFHRAIIASSLALHATFTEWLPAS